MSMRPVAPTPPKTAAPGLRTPSPDRGSKAQPSLMDVAKKAVDDLLDLLAAQIKLAKLELSADLGKVVGRLARIALFVPLLLVGYAFGMGSVASWLSRYWGTTAALAAVAAVQTVPAGLGILWALSALRRTRFLERTSVDAVDSVQMTVTSLSRPSSSVSVAPSGDSSRSPHG